MEEQDCVQGYLKMAFRELKKGGWIDSFTRVVTLSMTLFDLEHDLMCSVGIVWENLVLDRWWVIPEITPITPRGFGFQAATLLLVITCLVLKLLSANELHLQKLLWVLFIDLLMIITLLVHLNTYTQQSILLRDTKEKFLKDSPTNSSDGSYEGIEDLAQIQLRYYWLEITWTLSLILKVLFLDWYGCSRLTRIMRALQDGLRKHAYFLVLILIVLLFLSGVMSLQFGERIKWYSSLWQAFGTSVLMPLAYFDHEQFKEAGGITGQVTFMFLTLVLFVFVTQFIVSLFLSAMDVLSKPDSDQIKSSSPSFSSSFDRSWGGDPETLVMIKEELIRQLVQNVSKKQH